MLWHAIALGMLYGAALQYRSYSNYGFTQNIFQGMPTGQNLGELLDTHFRAQGVLDWKDRYATLNEGWHKDALRRMLINVFLWMSLMICFCMH